MRTQAATFVVAALVLVGAAPAVAVTGGFGVENALEGAPLSVVAVTAAHTERYTACHSSGPKAKSTGLAGQIQRKAAPVACEQAPRGQFLPPNALSKATAAALSVIG
jgi:hypothetical protein